MFSFSECFPAEIAEGIKKEQEKTAKMSDEEKAAYYQDAINRSKGELEDYDCDICNNKGFTVKVSTGLEVDYINCKCMDTRITHRMLKNSGLYEQIKNLTFKTFQADEDWQKSCVSTCASFCKNKKGWLYFGGQSGSGKTHLCTAVTGYLIKQGYKAKYMLWRDEIVQLKQNTTDGEMYQAKMDLLKNVPVLYIDDFFKTESGKLPTQSDIQTSYEFLNSRYNKKLITIISSELLTGELIEIDEAIAGRILEMSKGYCIDISKNRERNYRLRGVKSI